MAGRIQTVTFKRELAEGEKLAPQAKAIISSAIEQYGVDVEVTVAQVVAAMEGNVTTRQPLERIFGYYAPKLLEAELISVTRAEGKAKAEPEAEDEADDVEEGEESLA